MPLSPLFKLHETATPELLRLLESVTLGTNGAKYRHLDTPERIHTADHPLHLSLERNDRVLGNITFCRREDAWYIRYFAFDTGVQGTAKRKSGANGFLKRELQTFFSEALEGSGDFGKTDAFYAYIDPNNEKSLWMSENFGFETIGHLATQTFSRVNTKKAARVERTDDWSELEPLFRSQFGSYQYYFEAHLNKGNYFVLRDANGEIQACAKITKANWKIERLPGKMGGFLTKAIPFVPFLRRVIRPNRHTFLVPEAVIARNNDPKLLNELFEGILSLEKEHLLIWWVDERDTLYLETKDGLRWGLLHKLIGVNRVAIVERRAVESAAKESQPVYTCGFDFV